MGWGVGVLLGDAGGVVGFFMTGNDSELMEIAQRLFAADADKRAVWLC